MTRCTSPTPGQINTDDVFYTGSYLPNLDINTNTNLTTIIELLNTVFGSSNYTIKGGDNTQIADGLTTIFQIPHTLGSTPDTYSVEASNQNAAANFSVTSNSTNLILTYPVAPSEDATLSWNWQVTKL